MIRCESKKGHHKEIGQRAQIKLTNLVLTIKWRSCPISRIVETPEVDILTIYVGVFRSPEALSTFFLDIGGS